MLMMKNMCFYHDDLIHMQIRDWGICGSPAVYVIIAAVSPDSPYLNLHFFDFSPLFPQIGCMRRWESLCNYVAVLPDTRYLDGHEARQDKSLPSFRANITGIWYRPTNGEKKPSWRAGVQKKWEKVFSHGLDKTYPGMGAGARRRRQSSSSSLFTRLMAEKVGGGEVWWKKNTISSPLHLFVPLLKRQETGRGSLIL